VLLALALIILILAVAGGLVISKFLFLILIAALLIAVFLKVGRKSAS